MSTTVPAHLRCHLVAQDYDQYTEADHAVWRFVLLETYARLKETAHPAYASGLSATGISVERIPRIEEMNEKLARFGWAAVCVDGFIPPRAFQAFQANGFLPIAADIRSIAHLAYTPAPDIIHEAAGHAPILSDPEYARFLRRFGRVAERAFSSPIDRAIYRAIHTLSEIKEAPHVEAARLAEAEAELARALAAEVEPSESAKLARLYWWTAEYGLVGSPDDYRLYGAGLLSSLEESHTCHHPSVRKLSLSAECIEVAYDITRPQPQLFVARDFGHLDDVLSEVARGLAHEVGGSRALEAAVQSEEVATVLLDSGAEVVGILRQYADDSEGAWLEVGGEPAFAIEGRLRDDLPRPSTMVVPVGMTVEGLSLSELTPDGLSRLLDGDALALSLKNGIRIEARVDRAIEHRGRLVFLVVSSLEIVDSRGRAFRVRSPSTLPLAAKVRTARAGAPDGYFPPTRPNPLRVPQPRWFDAEERNLVSLFERAVDAHRTRSGGGLEETFAHVHDELLRRHPDEWLLRWNLLESLVKDRSRSALADTLERELVKVRERSEAGHPIGRGLAYIHALRQREGTR